MTNRSKLRNPPIQRFQKPEEGQILVNGVARKPLGIEEFLLAQVSQEQRHPEPRHIFRLWQIFVENVNPLVKILHVPTFQQRIFEVSWNIPSISKPTQAIMFAVYTLAIGSLSPAECLKLFDQDKNALFAQYRKSTMESLIAAELLSTRDIEVLQAFVLFLVCISLEKEAEAVHELTVIQLSDPDSDSTATLTALAVRIAQKMGLDKEKPPPKQSFFETEMRIRLWWQIRGTDARSRHQLSMCMSSPEFGSQVRLPLNINDSELHPNMAEAPTVHTGTTEMLYCLLKHEVGQWFRTSALTSKIFLKHKEPRALFGPSQPLEVKDQAIKELETIYIEKYLRHCDPRIPLHFMSLSISQLALCRMRFVSHHPRNQPDAGAHMPQTESDLVFENGVRLLELDIECTTTQFSQQLLSSMTARSQIDAMIYVLSELRRRATGDLVTRAWKVIGTLYEDYPDLAQDTTNTFYVALGDLTLSAWETRQRELLQRQGARIEEITPSYIYSLMATRKRETADPNTIPALGSDGFPGSTMLGLGGDAHLPGGWDPNSAFATNFTMPSVFGTAPLDWEYWDEFLQV
jgi:Fungal specific transcription factor domain